MVTSLHSSWVLEESHNLIRAGAGYAHAREVEVGKSDVELKEGVMGRRNLQALVRCIK